MRAAELVQFQSARLARSYLEQVRRVAGQESAATGDADLPITLAFARGLFALTATKDEYEVARLLLLPAEQEAFARAFPGARRVYMLKPPLLTSLGFKRKIKLVRSARPAFGVLRAGRRLRGTPFDVFGWTAERRAERAFLREYLDLVDGALAQLSSDTVAEVLFLVDAANRVHGYAHVRQASITRVRAEVATTLAAHLTRDFEHPTGSLATRNGHKSRERISI